MKGRSGDKTGAGGGGGGGKREGGAAPPPPGERKERFPIVFVQRRRRWDLTSGCSSVARGMAWDEGEERQRLVGRPGKRGDTRQSRGQAPPPPTSPAQEGQQGSPHIWETQGVRQGWRQLSGPDRDSWGQPSSHRPCPLQRRQEAEHREAASGRCPSPFQNSWMGPDSWWQDCLQLCLLRELAATPTWHCSRLHHPFLHKQRRL